MMTPPTLPPLQPAPPSFQPVDYVPRDIRAFNRPPPFIRNRGGSTVQKLGRAFERKCKSRLATLFPDTLIDTIWFRFFDPCARRLRWCSPDAILIDLPSLTLTLIEIKLSHCDFAWHQMRHLYYPVLANFRPFTPFETIHFIEIVRHHDADPRFPLLDTFSPPPLGYGIMLFSTLDRLAESAQ